MTWDGAPPPPAGHAPVLLAEVMDCLTPAPGDIIVDGTFGGGGYTRALLAAGAKVVAIDRDPQAIARAHELAGEADGLAVVEGTFGMLDAHLAEVGHTVADGVVLDVGVSSYQLDEGARGFSFRYDGPLDMRMGGDGPSAADVCNHADVSDLAHLLRTFGEERRAGAIARAIVAERPLTRTAELAALCERILGRGAPIHPATRTFQALRIAVNDELAELGRALMASERVLREGGRLAVVAFHSLEDRIVKRFLEARSRTPAGSRHMPVAAASAPTFAPITKRPVTASEAEAAANPRARSAKLRAARRTHAPLGDAPPPPVPHVRLKGVFAS